MTEYFVLGDTDPAELESERQRTNNLLGQLLDKNVFLEVGSTAVAGLIGKQDLDFLVRVTRNEFSKTRDILDGKFARHPLQLSTDIYQGYVVESHLDVAIQLTIQNGPHDNFVDFLELLRKHPDLRERYNRLKREHDGKLMDDYRAAKRRFIENALNNKER